MNHVSHFRPASLSALAGLASVLVASASCASDGQVSMLHQSSAGAPVDRSGELVETQVPEKTYSILWNVKVEGTAQRPYKPVELASPEYDDRNLLIFTATRDGFLTAFSARTHERIWEVRADGPFNAGPTLDGDVLYLASGSGKVEAFDAATGVRKWSHATQEAFTTKPVVTGGLVLAMDASDTLVALDAATGEWKWQYKRELPPGLTIFGGSRPAIRDGKAYVGFADGTAVALNLSDGSPVWEKELSRSKAFRDLDADPVIDEEGNVYFASSSDGLFCLDPENGNVRWSQLRQGITAIALDSGGSKVFAGGQGFIGLFSSEKGQMQWGRELRSGTAVTAIALTNGQVLASCGGEPLHVLEEETGRVRREFQPGHGVTAAATVTPDGDVLILSNRGYLYVMATHP